MKIASQELATMLTVSFHLLILWHEAKEAVL